MSKSCPVAKLCRCGALSIRGGAPLLRGGGVPGFCVGAPPRGEALPLRHSLDSRRGAAPTGRGIPGFCVGAPPRGEALPLRHSLDSRRGAAPTGRGAGFCVGAPPRGEALSLWHSLDSRCSAAPTGRGAGFLCRSPAPWRSFAVAALSIRGGAPLLRVGGPGFCVGAPPRGEALSLRRSLFAVQRRPCTGGALTLD